MNFSFLRISFSLTPILPSWSSNPCQLGSTFSELNPCSALNPICATCVKPEGAPIILLSILTLPFLAFLLLELEVFEDLAEVPA